MNYTQEELRELAAINTITDQEFGKRIATPQEIQVFNNTVEELFEQGFAVTKNNFLKLWLAFDSNPQVPITKPNILETVKVYRDQYQWKSATEMEFNKLSQQLGAEKTALVTKLLSAHRLFAPPDEGGVENFNALVRYGLSVGWGLDATSGVFQRLVGNFQTSSSRSQLHWMPTPGQIAAQKEREEKAKKDAAWRKEYQEFHRKAEPEVKAAELEKERLAAVEAYNEKWHGRVTDYIASIPSNIERSEAERLFSIPQGQGGWQQTWYNLDAWWGRRQTQRQMGMS